MISKLVSKKYGVPKENHGGKRLNETPLKWIVIHSAVCCDAEPTGAENLATYLQNGAGGRRVSWHYNVDSDSIAGSLDEDYIGWHTGSVTGNLHSIGIELAANVPAPWATDPKHKQMIDQTARLVADISHRTGIPTEPLTRQQLAAGLPGVVSHNLINITLPDAKSRHTDPGAGFPWTQLWNMSNDYLAAIEDPNIIERPVTTIVETGFTDTEAIQEYNEMFMLLDPHHVIGMFYLKYLNRKATHQEICSWLQQIKYNWTPTNIEHVRFGIANSNEATQ